MDLRWRGREGEMDATLEKCVIFEQFDGFYTVEIEYLCLTVPNCPLVTDRL